MGRYLISYRVGRLPCRVGRLPYRVGRLPYRVGLGLGLGLGPRVKVIGLGDFRCHDKQVQAQYMTCTSLVVGLPTIYWCQVVGYSAVVPFNF